MRRDVLAWRSTPPYFGDAVTPGAKAVHIAPQCNRRSADVLICAQFRRYFAPAQWHSLERRPNRELPETALAELHREASANEQLVQADRARVQEPVEPHDRRWPDPQDPGALLFSRRDALQRAGRIVRHQLRRHLRQLLNWLVNANPSQFLCANGPQWLVRDYSVTAWPTANYTLFPDNVREFWNQWP
jgi:hypothetical protein